MSAVTPVVEKAYGLGIPVVVIDRKILSDRYTAFVGARIVVAVGKHWLEV